MAVVKYGAMITEIKGKIGGSVFMGGWPNPIVKNINSGRRKYSAPGTFAKHNLSQSATTWRNLSDAQRTGWIGKASQYPALDKFGVPYTPSGYQVFVTCNTNLRTIGQSPIQNSVNTVAEQDISPFAVTYTDPDNVDVTYTPTANTSYTITIYASRPVSEGVQSEPKYKRLVRVIVDDSVGTTNIATALKNTFGDFISGQKFFLRAYVTRHANGRQYGNYVDTFVVS